MNRTMSRFGSRLGFAVAALVGLAQGGTPAATDPTVHFDIGPAPAGAEVTWLLSTSPATNGPGLRAEVFLAATSAGPTEPILMERVNSFGSRLEFQSDGATDGYFGQTLVLDGSGNPTPVVDVRQGTDAPFLSWWIEAP
jgi:hypothetical protein